jgi:SAM-dependent methyltransferase
MKVADIGCGMTAFTVYLKHEAGCDVVGVDPDVFESGIKYKGHGVSREFIDRTGLKFLRGDMDRFPLDDNSQDCVFCVSVMEHVTPDVRRRGMQEMARVLKPGGRAILTVDVSMWFELNRPLDLIWESGLTLSNPADLRWPPRRFGMFDSGKPADVFGMTLVKEGYRVDTEYRRGDEPVESVPPHLVPTLIPQPDSSTRPLWRRAAGRLAREVKNATGAGE